MKLTVIGCFGAYPKPGGATSGYLVEEGETKVLLDCGSGVLARLQEHLPLYELDGVVLTHYHPDHCADFGCLQYAVMIDTQLQRRTKGFTAWGPGEKERLTYGTYCQGRSYLEGASFQIGSLTFEWMQNIHEIPSCAIRISNPAGCSIVYSGDTGYYRELADFAGGTNCFLCESSFYGGYTGHIKEHLNCEQAAMLAKAAKAKQLVLTHFPHFGDIHTMLEQAGSLYDGKLLLAEQGLQISIAK